MEKKEKEEKKIMVEIKGKQIPLENLQCSKCEWRYSICCPKCEFNKNGEYKVY